MKNIAIIGTTLVDQIKYIDQYPAKNTLAKILTSSKAVGGIIPNVGIDLKMLDQSLNVIAIGKLGKDSNANYVLNILNKYHLDTSKMIIDDTKQTGFTDVMTLANGERTFFTYAGASATLTEDEVLNALDKDVDHVHIGYALLLGYLDTKDDCYKTKLAKLCAMIKQNYHCSISLDAVSSIDKNAKNIVLPVLKYVDYLIINELELAMIADIEVFKEGKLDQNLIKKAMEQVFKIGNLKKIIVHCPQVNICYNGVSFIVVSSLKLPDGFIKGAVGAGDAFAAGAIYGILNNFNEEQILRIGCASAVANLTANDSISGARSYDETMQFDNKYR